MKRTWQQKIADKPGYPKVLNLEKGFPCYNAVHKMGANEGDPVVIVNASEVAAIMQKVPKGKLITLAEICREIAGQHRVKACCTLVAGIHTMEIANAAEEMKAQGKLNDLSYWRTLKSDGSLNPKFPGGMENQKRLLEAEGHKVLHKGKNYFVQDFSKYLICLI